MVLSALQELKRLTVSMMLDFLARCREKFYK